MAGIFKAYDIRGIVPDQLDEVIAQKIGYAFAIELKAHAIAVGNDMRVSADAIKGAFIEGITSAGADVYDVGMCSTPFSYFASGALDVDGSAMVTASHNPQEYNGFKFSRSEARPVSYETGIGNIEKRVNTCDSIPDAAGKVIQTDIDEKYKNHILSFTDITRRVRVAVDAGNGMGGVEMEKYFSDQDIDIIPLYFEPDGSFPNHEPNPLKPENMKDLQDKVRESEAEFGAAFDGDADRVMFTDEKGDIISSDLITALFARDALEQEQGAAVIYDLRSSKVVREEIEKRGGTPIESRVGHSYIKGVMREHDAPVGGELSGHYYFRDNYYADSGIIAFGKLLSIVCGSDKPLSDLLKPLRRYHASGEINFKVEDKDGKIKELAEKFSDAEVSFLDGITVKSSGWWFNVRKSNTEPLLRLNLEADTKKIMEEGINNVSDILSA